MKKTKLLALITAILTGILVFIFFNTLSNHNEIDRAGIVVAIQDIPADTPITDSMVKVSQLPREAILSDAISDTSLVIGKVANSEIMTGEQILASKIVTAGDTAGASLSYILKPGMRAMTIAVDGVSGVGYMIEPGNHVDILAQYNQQETAFTKLIAQNVKVLAVDSALSNKDKTSEKNAAYSTITLQVSPEQVLDLGYYEFTGHLCVVVRSPLDGKLINLPIKQ